MMINLMMMIIMMTIIIMMCFLHPKGSLTQFSLGRRGVIQFTQDDDNGDDGHYHDDDDDNDDDDDDDMFHFCFHQEPLRRL